MQDLVLQLVIHSLDDIFIHTGELEEHVDSFEVHHMAGIKLKPA